MIIISNGFSFSSSGLASHNNSTVYLITKITKHTQESLPVYKAMPTFVTRKYYSQWRQTPDSGIVKAIALTIGWSPYEMYIFWHLFEIHQSILPSRCWNGNFILIIPFKNYSGATDYIKQTHLSCCLIRVFPGHWKLGTRIPGVVFQTAASELDLRT